MNRIYTNADKTELTPQIIQKMEEQWGEGKVKKIDCLRYVFIDKDVFNSSNFQELTYEYGTFVYALYYELLNYITCNGYKVKENMIHIKIRQVASTFNYDPQKAEEIFLQFNARFHLFELIDCTDFLGYKIYTTKSIVLFYDQENHKRVKAAERMAKSREARKEQDNQQHTDYTQYREDIEKENQQAEEQQQETQIQEQAIQEMEKDFPDDDYGFGFENNDINTDDYF